MIVITSFCNVWFNQIFMTTDFLNVLQSQVCTSTAIANNGGTSCNLSSTLLQPPVLQHLSGDMLGAAPVVNNQTQSL